MIENEKNLLNEVAKALAKDERNLVNNTELDVRRIINLIIADDEKVYKALLANKIIKNTLFKNVSDCLIFDKQKIIKFLKTNNQYIKNSYTRYANRIGLIDNDGEFIKDNDDVVLSFPYKDCILEFDSTDPDVERDEIFYNEIIAKDKITKLFDNKVFENVKKIAGEVKEKEVVKGKKKKIERKIKITEKEVDKFDINDNLLIKGNNLLAMYSLLTRYEGQIKLMYWDVLYNTKDDCVPYNDSFKHSSWLVMMKNRLEVAKQLLRDDGVICIQCDDNEMHYLKVLCDEIFKRDNYIDTIINQSANSVFGKRASSKDKTIIKTKDYILIYCKSEISNINTLYTKSDSQIYDSHDFFYIDGEKISTTTYFKQKHKMIFDKYGLDVTKKNIIKVLEIDGEFRTRIFNEIKDIFFEAINCKSEIDEFPSEIIKKINKGEIVEYKGIKYCRENEGRGNLRFLRPLSSSLGYSDDYNREYLKIDILGDVWNTSSAYQNINVEGGKGIELEGGKKPEIIIKNLVKMFTDENDIILDSFFGTGTTGAVAMKMGRRFIGIEQLDEHVEIAKTRLKNVINGDATGISEQVGWTGGGSFTYVEMAENNKKFKKMIKKATTDKELEKIFEMMVDTAYISVDVDLTKIDVKDKEFKSLSVKDKKKVLFSLLDKNYLYVNICDINDKEFKISEDYKKWTKSFYNI